MKTRIVCLSLIVITAGCGSVPPITGNDSSTDNNVEVMTVTDSGPDVVNIVDATDVATILPDVSPDNPLPDDIQDVVEIVDPPDIQDVAVDDATDTVIIDAGSVDDTVDVVPPMPDVQEIAVVDDVPDIIMDVVDESSDASMPIVDVTDVVNDEASVVDVVDVPVIVDSGTPDVVEEDAAIIPACIPYAATMGTIGNVALGKPASQDSDYNSGGCIRTADRAVNGIDCSVVSCFSISHTNLSDGAWWEVDLQDTYNIDNIVIHGYTFGSRASVFLELRDCFGAVITTIPFEGSNYPLTNTINIGGTGARYVRIYRNPNPFGDCSSRFNLDTCSLSFCEVEVNAHI